MNWRLSDAKRVGAKREVRATIELTGDELEDLLNSIDLQPAICVDLHAALGAVRSAEREAARR